jgi:glycosyltransferase involved in cell wall biosynthesis
MTEQKLRVLFVNPLAELGGSERSLLDLLASFRRAGAPVEPRLLALADGELVARSRALGVPAEVLRLPAALAGLGESTGPAAGPAGRAVPLARGAIATLPYLLELRRTLRASRPDIVHTNGLKAHVLAALAVPEFPRVVHLRDFAGSRWLSRSLLPMLGRRALVVANSRAVEADALAVAPRLRTRVVYNGIDLAEFRAGPRELAPLASFAGLDAPPDAALVIGMVATYAWWKGHRTFIEAAARLVSDCPRPLRFYVVGGPIYAAAGSQTSVAELRALLDRFGLGQNVGLVPFQREVGPVYRGLDIAVHASERAEPFGRTIVEAMASARAVVVSRAGGAAELFQEGESGLGFRPGDSADLARVLRVLIADDVQRQRLAAEAAREATTRFDRDRLAGEVVAAYRTLLGTG